MPATFRLTLSFAFYSFLCDWCSDVAYRAIGVLVLRIFRESLYHLNIYRMNTCMAQTEFVQCIDLACIDPPCIREVHLGVEPRRRYVGSSAHVIGASTVKVGRIFLPSFLAGGTDKYVTILLEFWCEVQSPSIIDGWPVVRSPISLNYRRLVGGARASPRMESTVLLVLVPFFV